MDTVARFEVEYTRYLDPQGAPTGPLPEFALDPARLIPLYRAMCLTRAFDAKAIALQRTGKLGTFASSLGQEAIGVGKHAIAMYDGANYLDWTMQNMIWNEGGAFSKEWDATFTDPGTIAGVERLKKIQDDGFLVVSKDSITEFASGLAACAMASTGSLKTATENAQFEFGTAFLPGARENKSCPTGGAGLAIPAKLPEERKINALKFINSITSTQGTAIFAQATGYMPVRKGAKEAQEIKSYLESTPQAVTAIEQLEFTRPQDNARVFVPGGGARIGGGLDKVLAGEPVPAVMEQLQSETQQIIDTQISPKLG